MRTSVGPHASRILPFASYSAHGLVRYRVRAHKVRFSACSLARDAVGKRKASRTQMIIRRSSAPVTNPVPSGSHEIAVTVSVCSSSVRIQFPVFQQ